MPNYHQGKFTPRNPEKYVGDVSNIVYRSSWEKKVLLWLDRHPSVLKYSSEEVVIPYVSPIDNRVHRYFVDFAMVYRNKQGETKRALIEVKPAAQTRPPVKPSRKTKRYITEAATFMVNTSKWDSAREWCAKNGFEFIILTEKELGL